MKYLPTTFPHTCTPWLNPPSHYKLKSYFYFLLPSLSLCLNYVFLAEKNFNLSYSPKILAYIFFPKWQVPRVTQLLTIFYCGSGSGSGKYGNAREHTETRGNIQNIPFSHKKYMLLAKYHTKKLFTTETKTNGYHTLHYHHSNFTTILPSVSLFLPFSVTEIRFRDPKGKSMP